MRSRILIAVLSLIATPALAQDLVVDAVRNCVYYSGSSGSRVGELRGQAWLKAAWLLAFGRFAGCLEVASCPDGAFSEATATAG